MYQLKIEVNFVPRSLNLVLRSHHLKNHRQRKLWDLIMSLKLKGKLPAEPLKKAHLKVTRHSPRTLDFDGCVGSLKPVVDSLVRAGVIVDDSWDVLGAWEVDQVFRPKKDGPLLTIEVTER